MSGKNEMTAISLQGRIDINNAPKIEEMINNTLASFDKAGVVFDASKLEYISSAGLRVLMKIKKGLGPGVLMTVENVSRDIYDIFETTGFTEILDIKRAYRSISVDGLEVIGKGFYGTVYRYDPETIIKVYKGKDSIPMIKNEKEMAKKAFISGIPTAISYDIVKVGEDFGSVFELINAKTFHEIAARDDEDFDGIMNKYTELLKLVHNTEMEPGALPSYKERYRSYIDTVSRHLTKEQYDALLRLISKLPEQNTVIHGDIQMKNVMLAKDEPILIDMDTLGLGNRVFEFAGLYVTYQAFEEDEPGNSMAFLGISNELANKFWNRIFEGCFKDADESMRGSILDRIRLAAAIRFLYLLESTNLKEGDLGRTRIAHTLEHIDRLLGRVDALEI